MSSGPRSANASSAKPVHQIPSVVQPRQRVRDHQPLEVLLNGEHAVVHLFDAKEGARFFDALASGRAQVALALDSRRGLNDPLSPPLEFARRIRDRFFGFQVVDATPALADLRMVKTAYERTLLVKSLEISSEAQMAGMRAARPGAYEYEVKAAIEAVHRSRGAASWSYPSIVGSGPNATILHYPGGDRQI